jgi:hypothetical protein
MLTGILVAALVQAETSYTQILLTNQLQCKQPYTMTVGYPQGDKALWVKIERAGEVAAQAKLDAFVSAAGAVFDADESGCEEALVDLTGGGTRGGVFVSFPKGKAKITVFPTSPDSAERSTRTRARIRVYGQQKKKMCVTDYAIKQDDLVKSFADCY